MKSLRLYRTKNGKEPFALWSDSLKNPVTLAHFNNRVRRLSLGQRGDYKRVGKGVFELRIHYMAQAIAFILPNTGKKLLFFC